MKSKVLPDSWLKCVSEKDRKKLGQRTAEEVLSNGVIKCEKQLQKSIIQLLNLKGIEVNVSRMDKRTTGKVGWPDITFAVVGKRELHIAGETHVFDDVYPCAFEVKLPGKPLEPHQEAMKALMTHGVNAWRHRVVTSVQQAAKELREMGIE